MCCKNFSFFGTGISFFFDTFVLWVFVFSNKIHFHFAQPVERHLLLQNRESPNSRLIRKVSLLTLSRWEKNTFILQYWTFCSPRAANFYYGLALIHVQNSLFIFVRYLNSILQLVPDDLEVMFQTLFSKKWRPVSHCLHFHN